MFTKISTHDEPAASFPAGHIGLLLALGGGSSRAWKECDVGLAKRRLECRNKTTTDRPNREDHDLTNDITWVETASNRETWTTMDRDFTNATTHPQRRRHYGDCPKHTYPHRPHPTWCSAATCRDDRVIHSHFYDDVTPPATQHNTTLNRLVYIPTRDNTGLELASRFCLSCRQAHHFIVSGFRLPTHYSQNTHNGSLFE